MVNTGQGGALSKHEICPSFKRSRALSIVDFLFLDSGFLNFFCVHFSGALQRLSFSKFSVTGARLVCLPVTDTLFLILALGVRYQVHV